jgi:nitric oxide reductase large subunit
MKVIVIIAILSIVFFIHQEFFSEEKDDDICPDGYVLKCVSQKFAGIPFPGKSPCKVPHVPICLPKKY